MINDTKRKAFETHVTGKLLLSVEKTAEGQYESQRVRELWSTWQAALSTKAQDVGEWVMVPREPTTKMLEAAIREQQYMLRASINPGQGDYPAKHIYQAMLSASPAPAPCTPEEGAELAKACKCEEAVNDLFYCSGKDIAAIINADRKKRNA